MRYPIEIQRIYVSEGHDFKGRYGMDPLRHETPSRSAVECVAGRGVKGDRYFGYKEDYKGQITFIDRETIDYVAGQVGDQSLDPASFRRNVVIEGVDLNELIGKRFRIGSVVFLGSEECAPCFWMDQVVGDGALKSMKGRGGLRCRILESGMLTTGARDLIVED